MGVVLFCQLSLVVVAAVAFVVAVVVVVTAIVVVVVAVVVVVVLDIFPSSPKHSIFLERNVIGQTCVVFDVCSSFILVVLPISVLFFLLILLYFLLVLILMILPYAIIS